MKKYLNISIALLCVLFSLAACSEKEAALVGLSVDKEEITLGENGGVDNLHITSDLAWVASTDKPWARLSPANGVGSTECTIVVDSSLVSDIREAKIVVRTTAGTGKVIKVKQIGYEKVIQISTEEVKVESTGKFGERFFDVSITTNVPFDIDIEEASSWVHFDRKQLDVDLDKGDRPRTVKFRFDWNMNTDPIERIADLLFKSTKPDAPVTSTLKVVQNAAPLIEDNRAGDSLAILTINERINCWSIIDPSEAMGNWENVTLWEKGDKWKGEPIGEEMIGRVRSVQFYLFQTKEDVPSEVSKLKYAEFISFYGNANKMHLNIELGDAFNELKKLRILELTAYGLISLPDGLANLEQLEELHLGSNNFDEIPSVLTPDNFPSLKVLSLATCRRTDRSDLSVDSPIGNGLYLSLSKNPDHMDQFKRLLAWDALHSLSLGVNYLEGHLPTSEDLLDSGFPTYTRKEVMANDTLATAESWLVDQPKVLPNATELRLQLNMLTGDLPDWILHHPNLYLYDPFTLIFNQEDGFDTDGKKARFDNVPASWDYYYEKYPLRKKEATN
ncbi:MAG: BACON domain-containing protein [Phocaeicola sp.]